MYDEFDYIDPLLRKVGTPLDSARHDADELEKRRGANPRAFEALWQQSPRISGGGTIKIEWFHEIEHKDLPRDRFIKSVVRGWDFAYTSKELTASRPHYSAGAKLALWYNEGSYHYIIMDLQRWQENWPVTKRRVQRIANDDGRKVRLAFEAGGAQRGIVDELMADDRFKGFNMRSLNPVNDKVARAQPWIDAAEVGKVWILVGSWTKAFYSECEKFPNGAYDDQIDAVSTSFEVLSPMTTRHSLTRLKVSGLYK